MLQQLLKQKVLAELKPLIWRGFFRSYYWTFEVAFRFIRFNVLLLKIKFLIYGVIIGAVSVVNA